MDDKAEKRRCSPTTASFSNAGIRVKVRAIKAENPCAAGITPIIRVEMFPGRTPEQKRALVRDLTDAFVKNAGGKPEGVYVVLTDVEKSNWGAGGQLYSDKFPD